MPPSELYKNFCNTEKEGIDKRIKKELEKMQEAYQTCQEHEGMPRMFKLTIGTENLQLEHRVILDTMFITSRPVILMIDEVTHFMVARLLKKQSVKGKKRCRKLTEHARNTKESRGGSSAPSARNSAGKSPHDFDTTFITSPLVIHMIDEATQFMVASFLKKQSAEEIWKTISNL